MVTYVYRLPGDAQHSQVEPSASYWHRCPILRTVRHNELLNEVGNVPPKPDADAEISLLRELRSKVNDEAYFNSVHGDNGKSPLSKFLQGDWMLERPVGAVLNKARVIKTGNDLATLFEAETPGLWHRHVLNLFFDPRRRLFGGNKPGVRSPADLSPPMQAIVWSAMETAISSALLACWHYKWLDQSSRFVERPHEYEEHAGATNRLEVSFDTAVPLDSTYVYVDGNRNAKKPSPMPSPGTPRHPAFPSGHSTHTKAASYVLGKLFPEYVEEFDRLADNIGWARLWGGVHWKSDHTFGQTVGKAVGKLVMRQLAETGIKQNPKPGVPTPESLSAEALDYIKDACQHETNLFEHGVWRSDTASPPSQVVI